MTENAAPSPRPAPGRIAPRGRAAPAAPRPRRRSRAASPGGPDAPAEAPAGRPSPFLKWAGGKGQLLDQYLALYPPLEKVRRYVEPFVGSGAVFFEIRNLAPGIPALLADGNEELVNAWRCVRDDVEGVIRRLARHRTRHEEAYFYEVRAQRPSRISPPARAARLIYLNKTCFNGLYRVNGSGAFNVPFGRHRNPAILDAANLRAVSHALQGVDLRCAHFRETLGPASAGDFVYFDPPYHPLSATASFTAYASRGGRSAFTADDQAELAGVARILRDRGCFVMLSNSETPFIRDLYRGFRLVNVSARRSINSRADRRGRIPEIVALGY